MTHPKFEKRFGKLRNWLIDKRTPAKLAFVIMGFLATVWFLIRVIPKPSRAGYPCMKAAFPVMATFILWLTSFTGAFIAFKKLGNLFRHSRYLVGSLVLIVGLTFSAILINTGPLKIKGNSAAIDVEVYHPSIEPMGTAQGIYPGRVVWNWNPDATDETCTNTYEDRYVLDSNTDQDVVYEMLENSVIALGGGTDVASSWNAIFKYFNQKKGKGETSYSSDETIFIKINEGTSSWYGENFSEPIRVTTKPPVAETSPQVVQAVLKQLIEIVGVPQNKIWVADPRSHLWNETFEKLSSAYPEVNYGDKDDKYVGEGNRKKLHPASEPSLYYSDKGDEMTEAVSDYLYEEMRSADYLINLAALKAHARAGITLTAKNHFGSHTRSTAAHLHPGLVAVEDDQVDRPDYGMYRVQVDLMGSSVLGGNTLLFLVDGLWSGTEAIKYPVKWTMAPFDNDWPSSIFISLDQVALESVCFDFLRHEAEVGSELFYDRPNFAQGVDDYLHQAADSENWPEGIIYDPDNSGTPIGSLGIHEHWNNPGQKQYSRNLGDKNGIELLAIPESLVVNEGVLQAREASTLPLIDGMIDDECWNTVYWYPIDKLWIPWGENNIPMEDFNGKFKVMWSAESDLLYFIVKTTDDVIVDNYIYPQGGYHNFDVVEVFIDEDKSGGGHIFDNDTDDAENAFSYHIVIKQPEDGGTTNTAHVMDIAGIDWGNMTNPDYFSHFPEFTVRRDGKTLYWEFSMQVHSDSYDPTNPEASLVQLYEGKEMGLSMAYCDNDTPGTERDNFFGSVEVSQEAYNNHWMFADDYGAFTLTAGGPVINHKPEIIGSISDLQFEERNVEQVVADLSAVFTDEDGDVLTYEAITEDSKLKLSVDGNILKATALPGFHGPAQVSIQCTDAAFYTVSIEFTVTAVNHAPESVQTMDTVTLDIIGQTQTVISNLTSYFSDPDGDQLSFSVKTNDSDLSAIITQISSLKITTTENFVGPAKVTVTASDGEYEVDLTFDVVSTVGIALNEIQESIRIYPNPVVDRIRFEFSSSLNGSVFVRIIGINGQIHRTSYFSKQQQVFEQSLSTNELDPGIYFLEIHNNGALVDMKFLKQ
ncbi:sugar-binding protein [Bacteroidota bacterium]